MGNTVTCPCNTTTKEGVLVMKEDGSLLKLRKGVLAKEVMTAHAGHRVVRCGSDRSVLPGSAELESSRLYFLMPAELARCREAYEKFWKAGETKGRVPPMRRNGGGDAVQLSDGSMVGGRGGSGQVFLFDSPELRSLWRPQLKTIPEITSPPTAARA